MTEQNFRDSLRAFNERPGASTGGDFLGKMFGTTSVGDSESLLDTVRTRTQDMMSNAPWNSQEDQGYFAMTRWQRIVGSAACIGLAFVCFAMAMFTVPMIPIRPQKFALAFSMGSLLAFAGLAIMQGPLSFFKSILSPDRLAFTGVYFGSMIMTLMFAMGGYYFFTIIGSIVELIALVWYLLSYIPGGTTGLTFVTRYFAQNSVGLPV